MIITRKSCSICTINLLMFSVLLCNNAVNADWLYQPEMIYTGDNPRDLAIADLDKDGHVEVLTSNGNITQPGEVAVLSGSGSGFSSLTSYEVGVQPFGLDVADLNGDLFPDVVTANYTSNYLSILPGFLGGIFSTQETYSPAGFMTDIALADVDDDTFVDLIYTSIFDKVYVALADGSGGFEAATEHAVGSQPLAVTVADVDLDGRLDIVTTNSQSASVSVLLAQVGGGFSAAVNYAVGPMPYSLKIADINGDSFPDIVTVNENDNSVSVLSGLLIGGFAPAVEYETGANPRDLDLLDINRDGLLDIVTANHESADVSIILAKASGGFSPPISLPVGFQYAVKKIATASLNGDNTADIIVAHNYQSSSEWSSIGVLLSQNDELPRAHARYQTGEEPTSVKVADVNGDSNNDVVVANSFSDTVSVYLGRSDGSLDDPVYYNTLHGRPRSVAIADVNLDGLIDIITANGREDSVSVLLGESTGGFLSASTYAVDDGPISVVTGDVNNDGKPDIITSNLDDNSVSVLYGKGSAGFETVKNFNAGFNPYHLVVTDLNMDGHLDIVTGSNGNTVHVLMGNASGFSAVNDFTVGNNPRSIAVADLNNDGFKDIVSANSTDSDVSVLIALPSGGYLASVNYSLGVLGDTGSVTILDVDLDGQLDVVVTDSAYGVTIFIGDGTGVLNTTRHFATVSRAGAIVGADLNHDGRPELITVSVANQTLEVLNNQGSATLVSATDDTLSTKTNTAVDSGDLLANDIGTGISLKEFSSTSIQGGLITSLGGNRFKYEPPTDFTGTDSFTYVITDGSKDSQATVVITVTAANNDPGGNNGGGGGGGGGGNPSLFLLWILAFCWLFNTQRPSIKNS